MTVLEQEKPPVFETVGDEPPRRRSRPAVALVLAVIAGGQIVATGSPETIGGRNTAAARIRFSLPTGVSPGELPVPVEPDGEGWRIDADDEVRVLHRLTGWALDRGAALEGLVVERPSLEDVYLELTGAADQPGGHSGGRADR